MDSDNLIHRSTNQSRITWKYVRDHEATKLSLPSTPLKFDNYIENIHNGNVNYNEKESKPASILRKLLCKEGQHKLNLLNANKARSKSVPIGKTTSVNFNSNKSDLQHSTESQEKDELCSYLQLVKNSTTTQDNLLMKERRSVRVKNLQLLTEKRNLEMKLRSSDGNSHDTSEPITKFNGNLKDSIKRHASPTEILETTKGYYKYLAHGKTLQKFTSHVKDSKNLITKNMDKEDSLICFNGNAFVLVNKLNFEQKPKMDTRHKTRTKSINMFNKDITSGSRTENSFNGSQCKIQTSEHNTGNTPGRINFEIEESDSPFAGFSHTTNIISTSEQNSRLSLPKEHSKIGNSGEKQDIPRENTSRKRKFKYVNAYETTNNLKQMKGEMQRRTLNKQPIKNNKIAGRPLNKLQIRKKPMNLRSKINYNHMSMKQLLQDIQRQKQEKKKPHKSGTMGSNRFMDAKKTTEDSKLPIIDDSPSCSRVIAVPSIKSFTTREIICGNNQKENHETQLIDKNIIVYISRPDEFSNRASILKERLIFNAEANDFEIQSCVNAEENEMKSCDSRLSDTGEQVTEETNAGANANSKVLDEEDAVSSENPTQTTQEATLSNNNNNVNTEKSNSPNSPVTVDPNLEVNSLYKSLIIQQKRYNNNNHTGKRCDNNGSLWTAEDSINNKTGKEKRLSHSIHVAEENGVLLDAIYVDYSLVIVQELSIMFYEQSPLGHVLGAQNMWIPKGQVQRLLLGNNGCSQRETSLNVINADDTVSYVELWTKEHKSERRERPVCDVFAAVYFMRKKATKPDKKVLQLENINAFSNDVRYIVKNHMRNIIVCWKEFDKDRAVTKIRLYEFECDYQTIDGVLEMQSVDYFITSLHNIEDGEELLMGFGESKTTVWNLEFGYVIATIDIGPQPQQTLWVKCERGFLFTLQNTKDDNLRLVAIRGTNHSWKQLTSFRVPKEYSDSSFRGICIEHGTIVAFYQNGVLCWNAQTGQLLMEAESTNINYFPSFKHVIISTMGQVIVKNALAYLTTM